MSSADRDWFREPDSGPRGWGGTPACWSLIALQALVWAVPPRVGASSLFDALALRPADVLRGGRVYEVATYALAPGADSPWDLVWALACLLVFGREVEARAGAARFLALYAAAVVVVGVVALPWIALVGGDGMLTGSAGAAIALLVAHTASRPYATVLGVPSIAVAFLLVALPASQHIVLARDTAWAAHLLGAGAGYAFSRRWGRSRKSLPGDAPAPPVSSEGGRGEEASGDEDVRRRVDLLLGKINREGLEALTDEERAFLRQASKRFRG